MRRPERAELVRIANYFCLLVAVSVCSVANLAGIPDSGFISVVLAQSAALTGVAIGNAQRLQQDGAGVQVDPARTARADRCEQKLSEKPGRHSILRVSHYGCLQGSDRRDAIENRQANKYKIPPAYFDADNEPLIDEYKNLFRIMQAPPASAQASDTPYKDVVDLGTVIARVKGLDAAHAEVAGRISLAVFFAEPMAIRTSAMRVRNPTKEVFRPACPRTRSAGGNGRPSRSPSRRLIQAECARRQGRGAGWNSDQRYNHWTAVRNG